MFHPCSVRLKKTERDGDGIKSVLLWLSPLAMGVFRGMNLVLNKKQKYISCALCHGEN